MGVELEQHPTEKGILAQETPAKSEGLRCFKEVLFFSAYNQNSYAIGHRD